jgi:hypothetical protein
MSSVALNYNRTPLLTDESADETTSEAVLVLGYPNLSLYVIGSGTTSSGVITIETADYNPSTAAASLYAGTWSPITTVNASDVSGDKQKVISISNAPYTWVRTRISTAIGGGGTISTVLVAV